MTLGARFRQWRRGLGTRRAVRRELEPLQPRIEPGSAAALIELARGLRTDWDEAVHRVVQFETDALRVGRASYWSLADDGASIRCEAGYVVATRSFEHGATLLFEQAPEYFEAIRDARTLPVADVRADPICRGLREYCDARGIVSMLDIPVWTSGRLAGVLCHEHVGAPRRWTVREEDFATGASQVVATALAARGHTRAEAAARRAAFLDAISRRISSLDAGEIARRTASLAVQDFADAVMVWRTGATGRLECVAFDHARIGGPYPGEDLYTELVNAPERLRVSLPYLVVHQRQSLLLPELSRRVLDELRIRPEDRALLRRAGVRSVVAVPLSPGGVVSGAIVFMARGDRRYGTDDVELAEQVAERAASALENARLYAVAREAIRARDDLLVLTAHELRTPLTALQLTVELMQRRAPGAREPEEATRLEGVAQQVHRIGALVDRVLCALKVRSEGMQLAREPCDLAAVVRSRVERVRGRAAGGIGVGAPEHLVGHWDAQRLGQALDLLLDNAIKFGDGKPVEVTLRSEGEEARLSVRDHGIGIAPERLSSIFDPFERAVPKEHFGGLGLGLYLAHAIVAAHGGSIEVTSRPGEGSTFVVRLPS